MSAPTVVNMINIRPARRALRVRPSVVVGGILVGFLILAAVISLFWTPHDPMAIDPSRRFLGPLVDGHVLGTDRLGRDVLSQLMVAARTSLVVAGLGSAAAMVVGVTLGLVAACAGGPADELIMRGCDILLSVPGVVFALVLAAKLGPGAGTMVTALVIFFTPSFARMTRSAAMTVLNEDFVTSARLYGRHQPFVAVRHVLPNIAAPLIVQLTSLFASGILVETSLSYIGAGVARPGISFGILLSEAQNSAGVEALVTVWPGLAIVVPVLGLSLLGDGLRELMDPKFARRAS